MVQYKLTYFNVRGLAETARQLFALAGQDFEDVRLKFEDLNEAAKEKMPFGQLPVLEVDGKQLAQSMAICRYLARQFELAGKTPFNEALVDSLGDQFNDYRTEMKPFFFVAVGMHKGDLEQLKKDVLIPARDKFLSMVTKFLKNNPSGFLVGDSVTWMDLLIAEHCSVMLGFVPEFLDGYPEVKTHMEKVHAIPKIKKWLESRPDTKF